MPSDIDAVRHPIIREALRMQATAPGIEIASMADIPAGTGLGSSGTFTVGLLRASHALERRPVSARQLAEEACRIEIDVLDRSVGKQDQYIAAYGGLTCFQFHPDDSVEVDAARDPGARACTSSRSTCCCSSRATADRRRRSSTTSDKRSTDGDTSMLDSLEFTAHLSHRIKDVARGQATAPGSPS